MKSLHWRPIAETTSLVREITAMIRCTDAYDTYLLPGPVMWDTSAQELVSEETNRTLLYQPGAVYHWIPEADLI